MEGWYHSLKEALSQIRLTIKQTLPTSNRNTMNETPVPCRKNTAIRLHYWLPDEDSDRDWHTEGDQGIQKWTEKNTTIALTYWVNFTGGGEVYTELSGIANLYFRQGIQKRQSFDQCTGLSDCHRDAGNSAVFKPSTFIPPARAKRPTTVAMNF